MEVGGRFINSLLYFCHIFLHLIQAHGQIQVHFIHTFKGARILFQLVALNTEIDWMHQQDQDQLELQLTKKCLLAVYKAALHPIQ